MTETRGERAPKPRVDTWVDAYDPSWRTRSNLQDPFIPLFMTVLVARFGPEWSILAGLMGIELLGSVPIWAVSDGALLALGLAALFEIGYTKSPELREVIGLSDPVLKGLVASSSTKTTTWGCKVS